MAGRQFRNGEKAAGRKVRASTDEPQYRVTSNKTGADAVHKPDALKRHTP
jgi:hypothetical protein